MSDILTSYFLYQPWLQDKAAGLLIMAGQLEEAIDLCQRENVLVTDDMAEQLTLPKSEDAAENDARNALLERVADCCLAQGSLVTSAYIPVIWLV